jgi:glucuronokinase
MTPAEGAAPARTALVGNPSDGYGGAVLAVALHELGATAVARAASRARIDPPSMLVDATVRRFAREFAPEALSSAIEWETTVPEGVGLGGSSAIVIATARSLCSLYSIDVDRDRLAAFALAVEREDLSIAGGRQDQVAEAYGGLTLMDFSSGAHEQLDPGLLPPLVIAWRDDCGEHSGIVHGDLRQRWASGDALVRDSMTALRTLAFNARAALIAGERGEFARCVDRSFDLRARILTLDARHIAMVERARACGAAANYTGSGGAVIAVCADETHREHVAEALSEIGCGVLAPAFKLSGSGDARRASRTSASRAARG